MGLVSGEGPGPHNQVVESHINPGAVAEGFQELILTNP